jgi:GNAT superfamily N-acetyltransferase
MLASSATALIRKQVAWRLDCDVGDLSAGSTVVKAHGPQLVGYHGVYVWQLEDATIISTPPGWQAAAQAAVTGQAPTTLRDPAFWLATLGAAIERIVGPSYQGYVDAAAFRPAASAPPVQRLGPADAPALERLAAACPRQEWTDSAIHFDHAPIFVHEYTGELMAAASAPQDGPGIASVGVITHPAWRGKGLGVAVVSALTADRLAWGFILHYQTLRANTPSVALARSLGYHDLATALGIRLRPEPANHT